MVGLTLASILALSACGASDDGLGAVSSRSDTEDAVPGTGQETDTAAVHTRRVPAEWEPQEAIWLQWPRDYEKVYEPGLAQVVATIVQYEDVHILVHDDRTRSSAESALATHGELDGASIGGDKSATGYGITWHDVPNDSAWMRDNGPRYVIEDGALRIQNWEFDAWGGAFGSSVSFGLDNTVPDQVGAIVGLPVDDVALVHERGDLEFNGSDAVALNWSVVGDENRNPGVTKAEVVDIMKEQFGVQRVVLIEGAPTGDFTKGHIDGIARFLDDNRVVVADCSDTSVCQPGGHDDQIYDSAAESFAVAGFEVIRWPFTAAITYQGFTFDADYMNWLVGNGFVIAVGFGDPVADEAAKAQLEQWFPGRDVFVIEMLDSWINGGGVHCHTNDQPLPMEQ